jgi:hypothetical protein
MSQSTPRAPFNARTLYAPALTPIPELAALFAKSARLHAPLLRSFAVEAGRKHFVVLGADLRDGERTPEGAARSVVLRCWGWRADRSPQEVFVNGEAFSIGHKMSGFTVYRTPSGSPPEAPVRPGKSRRRLSK